MNIGVASLLDYVVLRHPGFGWPAQLHYEGAIRSVIISVMANPFLDTSRSNHKSPTPNDAMLVKDRLKTSPIIQLQLQTVEYVGDLVWIIQDGCRFEYFCVA